MRRAASINSYGYAKIGLLVLILPASGCAFATAHQGPALMEPGEPVVRYGGSLGGFYQVQAPGNDTSEQWDPTAGIPLMFMEGRWSLKENLEFGIKTAGIPYLGTMAADLKYQLSGGPFMVTADMGATILQFQTLGLHPTILFGSDNH